ncbi:MAG: glycoside hydrolase family 127 protein [Clostridia bacterium]|nr:glycoside hydrolase family 127 protein [Clostridia bacterium]MBQ7348287.1 glycoside hydrolase family 127 protein [Clostridia bacterium]
MVLERETICYADLKGALAKAITFIKENQIMDVALWRKCVEQFRIRPDGKKRAWRGEYWGKMMRGACMIQSCTHDDELYRVLEDSVHDLLTTQDELGRFSTYTVELEFNGWDMWCRKYVLLGFQYFLEICRDGLLKERIVAAMCRHADYILDKIGSEKGKLDILRTSRAWGAVNSSSILEPMVRLYRLTGVQKYLDFASYIVDRGFCLDGNLIKRALEDVRIPFEYPSVKAYEIMSCFEGLIAYYEVTGIEIYKIAALNFGKKVLETEVSVIGCSGCTHELFDHTSVMQTKNDYPGIMQETCVTVTLMKLCAALLKLSGDATYADQIEQSFYNAYLGCLNTHHKKVVSEEQPEMDIPQFLPFDSYSPLTAGTRGRKVGGYQSFGDGSFYGCCACIGAAGIGVMLQNACMRSEHGVVLNFYLPGNIDTTTPSGKPLHLAIDTAYPYDGKVAVKLSLESEERFALTLRIPAWCRKAGLTVNGEVHSTQNGYVTVTRIWKNGDTIVLTLDMTVARILPPVGAENQNLYAAYRRGAIMLASDRRISDPDMAHPIVYDQNGLVESRSCDCPEIPDHEICVELQQLDGTSVRLVDYASAGKTWDEESKCAVWLYR